MDVDGKDAERERERGKVLERNVAVLKKSGRVGEKEREVRRRVGSPFPWVWGTEC